MRLAFRLFFYSLLALVIAIWIALGLFKAEYLKAPLSSWVKQQTGQPLQIGRIEFNPFYPNVMLLEQVKLGDVFHADKIYIEVAEGAWWHRRIELAHLDLIGSRLQLAPGQRWPALPLLQLTVRDLNAERLTLLGPDWVLGDASLQVANWQPLVEGRWQPDSRLTLTGRAKRLQWHGLELANLELEGKRQTQGWQFEHLQAQLFDGRLSTALEWQSTTQSLQLKHPVIQQMRLTTTDLPSLPWQRVEILDGDIRELSVSQPDKKLIFNQLNVTVPRLLWQADGQIEGNLQGKLGELALEDLSINNIQGELILHPTRWQGQLQAQLWEGSLTLDGAYLPQQQLLDLDTVTLADWQAELPADWRSRSLPWPITQLRLHRLDGKRLALLSYDDQIPLSLKGLDLFATDLELTDSGFTPLNDKSRWEITWGELVYGSLVSRRGELQAELTAEQWRLKNLSLPIDGGDIKAEGSWPRDSQAAYQLTLRARKLPLETLSRFWQPTYDVGGRLDLNAELQTKGQDTPAWLANLQGTIALQGQDLFLDQLQFDRYLDDLSDRLPPVTSWSQLTPALLGTGTGVNQMTLALRINQGVVQFDGGIATISHLIAPSGAVALATAHWQADVDVLNKRGCSDIRIAVNGELANPQLSASIPDGCDKKSAAGVTYPPQGRLGSLRPSQPD